MGGCLGGELEVGSLIEFNRRVFVVQEIRWHSQHTNEIEWAATLTNVSVLPPSVTPEEEINAISSLVRILEDTQ
jgi:hypothetical protein